MLKRQLRAKPVLTAAGHILGAYLKFVRKTTRFTFEPADIYAQLEDHLPIIVASWHGQHFLVALMRRPGHDFAVLVSLSPDGEINAVAAQSMGLKVIRGSTARERHRTIEKGGARGMREMIAALKQGLSVAQTADISLTESRRCGLGIITMAKLSGRPIVPVASVTRWHIAIKSWDRTSVPLPFGRGGCVVAAPIYVPADAGEAELESARQRVESVLNAAQDRAEALAAGER
ncbi:MAG: lysophospholipid acyltransferase family protein [Hyphomicrobiales bacterium]|nr:lysophospholipid acyltransferase family protein [Hyphomicrobiales bacterium]